MQQEKAAQVAEADAKHLQHTSFGYAINLVMDYGNGRQVTISGTLPLGAPLSQFNAELDKLRLATNRQQAFVILRDRQTKKKAEEKMVAALELMLEEYDRQIEKEMERIRSAPESLHKGTQQLRTQVTAQIENLRSQANNFKMQKQQELEQHRAEIGICEVIASSVQKEIDEINNDEG